MNDKYLIKELTLTDTFLGNETIQFSEGLNCIMGARGTGKTTLLEFLRFVLDLEVPLDPDKQKQIQALLETNLGRGVVEAIIQKPDGSTYRVERSRGSAPRVFNSEDEFINIDVKNILGADVFAQGEIEAIASKPDAQLSRLIDQFDGKNLLDIDRKRKSLVDKLKQNSNEQLRVRNEIEQIGESIQQMGDVEDQLKKMKKNKKAVKTKEYSEIETEETKIRDADLESELLNGVEEWLHEIEEKYSEILDLFKAQSGLFLIEDEYGGTNKPEIETLRKTISGSVEVLASQANNSLKELGRVMGELAKISSAMDKKHSKQTKEYEELLSKYKTFQAESKKVIALQKKVDQISKYKKSVTAKGSELKALAKTRSEHKEQLAKLIEQRFAKRNEIVKQLNAELGEEVRVEIEEGALRNDYFSALMDIFYGSNLKYSSIVEKIVNYYTPEDFSTAVRSKDRTSLKSCLGKEENRLDQILTHLSSDGGARLFQIESLSVDDKPLISLRIKDGNDLSDFRASEFLSTGQKCTTILPILLFKGSEPLLIDQPEDNLDNQYIFSTIVKLIKDVSPRRQLIFITHNPNIPVLGNADFNLILRSKEGKGAILKRGSLDDVKSEIIEYLEGGREAFEAREKIYFRTV